MVKVLIVDDSVVFRSWLGKELAKTPGIEIIGMASDPYAAFDILRKTPPDAIVLDIEMPRMNGLTFLRKLMHHQPIPTAVVSSLTNHGCQLALDCLSAGAVDVFAKPGNGYTPQHLTRDLSCMLRGATSIKVTKRPAPDESSKATQPKKHNHASSAPNLAAADSLPESPSSKVVVIGSSTGGTEALRKIFPKLDAMTPGIVIVQHMPKLFTASLAQGLNSVSPMTVREAKDGDRINRGVALLAPGEEQLQVHKDAKGFYVRVAPGPRIKHHCPSVELLFSSTAKAAGSKSMGVILTGMGNDGCDGMLDLKHAGAFTVAQDEASCVVYGMPKAAVDLGATDICIPLDDVANQIAAFRLNSQRRAG